MFKRLLAAAVVMSLPLGAFADDTATAPDATAQPAASTAPANNDPAAAAGLGPQTSGSAGGSNADAAALQPAGLAPVQSSSSDSTGLTAPAGALQAPAATSDQLKVLAGEADGASVSLGDDSEDPLWPWVGLLASAMVLAALAIIWRDRRSFRDSDSI